MTGKNVLLTKLDDPLLGAVLLQHQRRTDDLIFCLGGTTQHPAEFDAARVTFIELQDAFALQFDEVWHSSTPRRRLDEELQIFRQVLSVIKTSRIPVINYIHHGGTSWERAQALALLYPDEPSRWSHDAEKSAIGIEILEAGREIGLNYRVFEPANLVDIEGKWPMTNEFYGLLAQIVSFKNDVEDKIENYFQRHALRIRSNLAMNLLSIEEAAERIFNVAASHDTLNGFYRIAGTVSVSLKNHLGVLAQNIGMQLEHVSPATPLDPIDALFESEMRLVQFQPENVAEEQADNGEIVRSFLTSYAERPREEVETDVSRLLVRREMRLENGELLSYHAGGRGERTIVIVNAFGQRLTYWTRFIRELRETYRLIVWLPRGSGPEHREDLRSVLTDEKVESCEFVGWCTGPKLILDYYAKYPAQVASMIFLGATFKNLPGKSQLETDYERGLEPLLKMVHDRPQLAGRLKSALQGVLLAGKMDDRSSGHTPASLTQMLGFPCPDLKEAVIGPFATDEGIVNYAGQILDFWQHDASELFENVRVPVLFVTGEYDRIASPRMAQAAAQLIPDASYVEVKGGSHYLQYEKYSLTACLVDQFLRDGVERSLTYMRSA
jgi:pimeloyl-ACP methyl ester carboxylesterase